MTPILEAVVVGIGTFFAFNLWLILVPHLADQQSPERGNIITLEFCALITAILAGWFAL